MEEPATNGIRGNEISTSLPEDLNSNTTLVTEIESLCMECRDNGVTKIMVTAIPHFKEIVVLSFECEKCGFKNNEVQQSAGIEDYGVRITLSVEKAEDLNRQVVKSEFATLRLEELEFEVPAETQKGICNTIEGILSNAVSDLLLLQEERRKNDEQLANQLDTVIEALNQHATGEKFPFVIVLDDPSGRSYIEHLRHLPVDPQVHVERYKATIEQLHAMGYYETEAPDNTLDQINGTVTDELPDDIHLRDWNLNTSLEENLQTQDEDEGATFVVGCPRCGLSGESNVCKIDVPGFHKCVLIAFACEFCGAKENEIKSVEAFGDKGRRWKLDVLDQKDLNRDVLISDFAYVSIPHLSFEMASGTQGSTYTTLEGLISKIVEHLETYQPFLLGDSANTEDRVARLEAINKIKQLITDPTVLPFRFILDDCIDHSFIGGRESSALSNGCDSNLVFEYYERTSEQNEELGIAS